MNFCFDSEWMRMKDKEGAVVTLPGTAFVMNSSSGSSMRPASRAETSQKGWFVIGAGRLMLDIHKSAKHSIQKSMHWSTSIVFRRGFEDRALGHAALYRDSE